MRTQKNTSDFSIYRLKLKKENSSSEQQQQKEKRKLLANAGNLSKREHCTATQTHGYALIHLKLHIRFHNLSKLSFIFDFV